MNLPSPDEQLDLHGPRAQLPFEQIPPQSRAGVKSSHESLEKGHVALVSNGVITSGGPPDTGSNKSGAKNNSYSTSTSKMDDRPQRPLHAQHPSYGVFGKDMTPPPAKPSRFQTIAAIFKRFLGFVGPGYIVSVGYMDPGNWATDLAGGSSFGYMLLFVILLSNLMAVVLQGLAVKLGVVSGLDLAQACRKFTPKYVNWVLYVLAELAIIACDLAEVIGSAIALNLLFNIPLPWGVAITAVDVLIILFAFRDDQSVKSRRLFEALVILLVSAVGACFTAEIVYAEPVAKDVFKGFLPNLEILTNKEALYLAIGIIGATVMPHNLYLHSSIVKLRASKELNKLASSQASMSSSCDLMDTDERQVMLENDKGAVSMKHSTIRTTLRYTFWDSTVALTFALYVNSAILIVSAATFKYKFPDADNSGLADFFDAFHLLSSYLGKGAGYVFAIALLMAGQSSTLTATLAGQIIMEGFLGASYLKPWVRRLLTRSLAIIPALAIVLVKGKSGLSGLLLASQVALSVQLPFAVIPLVLFTSMGRCMTIPVQDNDDKPGEGAKSGHARYEEELRKQKATAEEAISATASSSPSVFQADEENTTAPVTLSVVDTQGQGARDGSKVLLHNFANAWWLVGISGLISVVLLGLNFYLLLQTVRGN
ncbi:hypothetical protein BGZ52_003013 [Haplosporangium bisporale]|nr:hypothetical protein BGZ52_003013 [Haplosporangium bisporale]